MTDSTLPLIDEWALDFKPVNPRAKAVMGRTSLRARQRRRLACGLMLLVALGFAGWAAAQSPDPAALAIANAAPPRGLEQAAHDLAAHADAAVQRQGAMLGEIAARFGPGSRASGTDCANRMRELVQAEPHLINAGIVDKDGYVLCSALSAESTPYMGDRGHIRSALQDGRDTSADMVVNLPSQRATLHVSVPVRDAAGVITGAAYAALDLSPVIDGLAQGAARAPADPRVRLLAIGPSASGGARHVQETRPAGGFLHGAASGRLPIGSGFGPAEAGAGDRAPPPGGLPLDARAQMEQTKRRLLVVFAVAAAIVALAYVWASGWLTRRHAR
jgi:hypothetical protein